MSWTRRHLLERGGLVALAAALLYLWVAPHHVVDGDNSEFATLGKTGGAAHPSGYPLYILWLRAMSWLPGVSPAHTGAIATALLGAATVLVLHAACRAWGARPLAATLAVALFATGPVVQRVVSEAEVFALNNLVVATVLWLSAQRGPVRGVWRAVLLGFVAGLGLADHLTCALVAPVGLLGLVRAARELRGERPAVIAAIAAITLAVIGLALGLTPYAYLFVAPETPMSWGAVRDFDRLLAMVLREEYGGPGAFKTVGHDVSAATNLAALAHTVGRAWLWLPAIAGVVALGARIAAPSAVDREPRAGWIALALAFVIAGPLLVLRFNVPPEGLGLYVCQRFHLLPALLLAIAVADAFDRIADRFGDRITDRLTPTRATLLAAGAATLGVIAFASPSLSYVGRVHSPAVEVGAKNMLHSLPPGAVIIHAQDELHAVTGYVQWALGQRQDVIVVTWPLMKLPWYRERVARRGITSGPGSGSPQVKLVGHLLARGKPVFIDRLQREIIESFPTHPYGALIRVLRRDAIMPTVREVFTINEELYAQFAFDYPRPGPDDEFATEVHNRYAATWTMIGTMLERHGDAALAARAFEHAKRLGPSD